MSSTPSIIMPAPDCPVCNHPSSPTVSSSSMNNTRSPRQRPVTFRDTLSIITELPDQPVEKSAFSPDTESAESFRERDQIHERHNHNDDFGSPATVVGELPEEEYDVFSAPKHPFESGTKQNYHHREQSVYIKNQDSPPNILSNSPEPVIRQGPHRITTVHNQNVPYYDFRPEQDLDHTHNLPQTPHTTRTARSERSLFSRILYPFWSSKTEEMAPTMLHQTYVSKPLPPTIKGELPRHTRPLTPEPEMAPWNPLRIMKKSKHLHGRYNHHDDPEKWMKKRKKDRKRWCLIILIIILLFLLGETVFLNIRVSQLNNIMSDAGIMPSSNGTPSSGGKANQLTTDQQACLTQFQVNAPSSPTSYACGSCLPILQGVPSSFLSASTTDTATSQNITNGIQFCGLKSIFDAAGNGGNNPLGNAGWLKDVAFCTWTGVTCGGDGKVSQLELDSPALPSSFPDQMGALTSLQSLKVIGNNQLPAGTIPGSFHNFTALTSILIQNTGLTGSLPDIFSGMKQLKTLGFQSNLKMQIALPPSLLQAPLQNLLVNSQPLSSNLSFFSSNPSSSPLLQSLQILSLTNTSLSGPIPALDTTLPNLTELHLGTNKLTLPLPGNFPPKLTIVDLSTNPGLGGASVPQQFCNAGQVKSCSLQGSGMTNACGNCQV